MKNIIKIFTAIFLVAGFTNTLKAQVKFTATAGAELVQVLKIENTTPLHFGTIGITSGTPGTVQMTTAGLRNPTGGATIINTGTQKAVALFKLTGTPSKSYTISIESPINIKIGASGTGDQATTIDVLRIKVDNNPESDLALTPTGTLDGTGSSSFLLGGTLNIAATQQIGTYSGTYLVTVDYQ